MINDLVRRVVSFVEVVAPDGGDAVVGALAGELQRLAPYDEGELLLTLAAGVHRRALTPQGVSLVGPDFLARLAEQHGFARIDDALAAEQRACAREVLAHRRLRSLLAVSIEFGGAARGAVVLAARRPCAFAAAPTQTLLVLAGAAGLALIHALKQTGLHGEQEILRREVRRLTAALAERDQAAFLARCESEAREAEREAMQRALEELRCRDDAIRRAAVADSAASGAAAVPGVGAARPPAANNASGTRRRRR
jgi:GAF domain-containing protein